MGPAEALALGADVLVIGRPITERRDPAAGGGRDWSARLRLAA